MSVPAWKKAIIERRKKAEDEEKKKQAEEEAYLATLPPWKRALVQKRERERLQQLEREKAAGGSGDGGNAVQPNNSFQNRQAQQQPEREKGGWGGSRRVTPPSSSGATSPTSPPHDSSHRFFSTASSTPASSAGTKRTTRGRRSSVTTLPGADEPVAAKVASAPAPRPALSVATQRPRASSESSAVSVVSSFMKLNQSEQSNEMPAWKKALLERRKEKERAAGGSKSPDTSSLSTYAPGESLPLARKKSPPQDGGVVGEPASGLAMNRKPSPVDGVATAPTEPTPLQLQRRPSPVEHTDSSKKNSSEKFGTKPLERPQPGRTDPMKSEPKPLGLAKKTSPVESAGTNWNQSLRSGSETTRSRDSETSSGRKSPADGSEPKRKDSKPVPLRMAPVAPTAAGKKNEPQPKQLSSSSVKQQGSLSRARQRPAPEVVNRGGRSEPTPHQSQVIQEEGVTHRAPVYREVPEWANVSEEDDKFRKLPTWKQALIRRRRADIAKRMGHTTSVDDVPLANGPVPNNNQQGTESVHQNSRGVPSEDRTASIPPWKKQMMQRKGLTGTSLMSVHEKKQLQPKREPPTSTNTNMKELLGRFNKPSSPSPSPPPPPSTSTTVPKVTITSRSPSPSSPSQLPHHPTSSRPPPSSAGVPPVSTSGHTPRRTFTWTPGEDTMPGEALSDDSSGEDDEEEGEGEYSITNIDDTSDEEEEEGEGGESSGVVLLRPPQMITSSSTTDIPSATSTSGEDGTQKVRKTSSIMVMSGRPKKRVSPFN